MTQQSVYRPAIRTTYDGPTSARPARVLAVFGAFSVYTHWDNTKSDPENHRAAAEVFAVQLPWFDPKEPLIGGGFGQTYFWVFDTR